MPKPGKCKQCRRLTYQEDYGAQIRSSSAWQRARAAVKARDGYRCVVCRDSTKLEVDHITPLQDNGPAFDLSNLRTAARNTTQEGAVF
jgi:5-methylcytosine-specific restriction endonuclease McrA